MTGLITLFLGLLAAYATLGAIFIGAMGYPSPRGRRAQRQARFEFIAATLLCSWATWLLVVVGLFVQARPDAVRLMAWTPFA